VKPHQTAGGNPEKMRFLFTQNKASAVEYNQGKTAGATKNGFFRGLKQYSKPP
jgi:hypothetical protein